MGRRRSGEDVLVAAAIALTIGLVVGIFKLLAALVRRGESRRDAGDRESAGANATAAVAVLVLVGGVVAALTIASGDRGERRSESAAAEPPRVAPRELGRESLREAELCVERKDWTCAADRITTAEAEGIDASNARARASALLVAEGREQFEASKRAKRKVRVQLVEQANANLTRADAFHAIDDASAAKLATAVRADLKRLKPVASKSTTAGSSRVADFVEVRTDERRSKPDTIQVAPKSSTSCAENGSCYGDISTATGRAKTVEVRGYYRKDGTYVRGHYRSRSR